MDIKIKNNIKDLLSTVRESIPKQESREVLIFDSKPGVEESIRLAYQKPKLVRKVKSDEEWTKIARDNGFNDMNHVKEWLKFHGLTADGKLGKLSLDKLKEEEDLAKWDYEASRYGFADMDEVKEWQEAQGYTIDGKPLAIDGKMGKDSIAKWKQLNGIITPIDGSGMTPQGSIQDITKNYRDRNNAKTITTINGRDYLIYDPDLPKSSNTPYLIDKRGFIRDMDSKTIIDLDPTTRSYILERVGFKKYGGNLNKINYFQQGGTAKPNIQQLVSQLVQAAMQGDQQATETINKIMQSAQNGDQQAIQIGQLIQEEVKKLQGQATVAKWGSKLGYIQRLKHGKGGKSCPACEQKKQGGKTSKC